MREFTISSQVKLLINDLYDKESFDTSKDINKYKLGNDNMTTKVVQIFSNFIIEDPLLIIEFVKADFDFIFFQLIFDLDLINKFSLDIIIEELSKLIYQVRRKYSQLYLTKRILKLLKKDGDKHEESNNNNVKPACSMLIELLNFQLKKV